MLQIRRSAERGFADHGWLKSYHTFSFADYYDPQFKGFRALRVINEDQIAPGAGFGTHGHRDMEIISYVLSGQLEHKDSLGHGEVLKAGEFQRISAGTGITHSEFNPSSDQPNHFYQIWLLPERRGITPSYQQTRLNAVDRRNRLQLIASPQGSDGSLVIHQDAKIYLLDLEEHQSLTYHPQENRHTWLQVLRGDVTVSGELLNSGDAIATSSPSQIVMQAATTCEMMLFDLA